MMTTIEGNKLIAEFMGAIFMKYAWGNPGDMAYYYNGVNVKTPTPHASSWWEERQLGYHTSWDWLMPVVHKIESIDSDKIDSRVTIERQECRIYFDSDNGKYEWMFGGLPKIESTWKSIVRFIQWLNNQKQ